MALEIFWSKKADKQFDSVITYLESEWSEKVVRLFVKKTYIFLEILCNFPEIGTLENKGLNIRGFVVFKQITVFYKIQEDKIIILNFYDNRQNPKKKRL